MKVSALIEELKKYPQDLEVMIQHFDYPMVALEITIVEESNFVKEPNETKIVFLRAK